jgi:hypothetical protein
MPAAADLASLLVDEKVGSVPEKTLNGRVEKKDRVLAREADFVAPERGTRSDALGELTAGLLGRSKQDRKRSTESAAFSGSPDFFLYGKHE